MTENEMFTKQFRDGIFNYRQICAQDPTVCIMGYDDFSLFHAIAKAECLVPMQKTDPEFGKTKWCGIQIFEGDKAEGMTFGR